MLHEDNWIVGFGLAGVLVAIAGIIGWVLNIIAIAGSDFGTITALLVLRVIGIFVPPLGAVLGFI